MSHDDKHSRGVVRQRADVGAVINALSMRLGDISNEYACKCGTNEHGCKHCTLWVKAVQDAQIEAAEALSAPPSIAAQGRSFPICKDHRDADWNQPVLEDDSCILCRLFYLEAQESLLEEWQQRAKRAEDAIAEIERPLDAQMARLNATVARLNEENARLRASAPSASAATVPLAEVQEVYDMIGRNVRDIAPHLKPHEQPWSVDDHERNGRYNVWMICHDALKRIVHRLGGTTQRTESERS